MLSTEGLDVRLRYDETQIDAVEFAIVDNDVVQRKTAWAFTDESRHSSRFAR